MLCQRIKNLALSCNEQVLEKAVLMFFAEPQKDFSKVPTQGWEWLFIIKKSHKEIKKGVVLSINSLLKMLFSERLQLVV